MCVQLLNTDVKCPKYIEELLKVYLSLPVQQTEQQNKVSDIFSHIYGNFGENNIFCLHDAYKEKT